MPSVDHGTDDICRKTWAYIFCLSKYDNTDIPRLPSQHDDGQDDGEVVVNLPPNYNTRAVCNKNMLTDCQNRIEPYKQHLKCSVELPNQKTRDIAVTS